jgi:hypothetical protein
MQAELPALVGQRPVAALGKFDSLHAGHRALARAAAALGDANLVRLTQVERALGKPEQAPIAACSDRPRVLTAWSTVASEAELPLPSVMALSPEEFVGTLAYMGAFGVCAGSDFRFGKHRKGDTSSLLRLAREYNMFCDVVDVELDSSNARKLASSSRVRQLLSDGMPAEASHILERPHRVVLHRPHDRSTSNGNGTSPTTASPASAKQHADGRSWNHHGAKFQATNLAPAPGEYLACVLHGNGHAKPSTLLAHNARVHIDEHGRVDLGEAAADAEPLHNAAIDLFHGPGDAIDATAFTIADLQARVREENAQQLAFHS